jgi:hypothetical protein
MRKVFGCLGVLFASSLAVAQVSVQHIALSDVVEEEGNIYYPGRDPEAYAGQDLIDALETAVWGTSFDSEVWNLDLDFPVREGNYATGRSRLGLPFEVSFGSLQTVTNADGSVFGIWFGTVSALGDFHLAGAYIETAELTTLVPLYSRVDQHKMGRLVRGFDSRLWACNLDPIALHQSNQNAAMMMNCIQTHTNASYSQLVVCGIGAAATCWSTVGITCIGFGICATAVAVNEYYWRNAFDNMKSMNMTCLCNDVTMRAAFPEIPTPTSPCSAFVCPTNPFLIIPSIK